jgi:hypothetical protein
MYARVVTFENAASIDETADMIRDGEAPEGVPATAVYFMADRESGKVVVVTLFATEEDMRTGHETLSAMSPPGAGLGERTSVDLLEVVAHRTAS